MRMKPVGRQGQPLPERVRSTDYYRNLGVGSGWANYYMWIILAVRVHISIHQIHKVGNNKDGCGLLNCENITGAWIYAKTG